MATLHDLLAEHTTLPDAAAAHLQRLVAEWQLLADLSFADYLLAVRGTDGNLVYVAQCRPNTASTVFQQDEVGHRVERPASPQGANPLIITALETGRIEQDSIATRFGNLLIDRIAIPVTFDGRVIAVLGRAGDASETRPASPLEAAYRDAAQALCEMVVEGTFPLDEANTLGLSTPRAGDGFIRVGPDGRVVYASPNALSAVHRMGWTTDLSGVVVADLVARLLTDPFESADAAAMIEAASGDALPGPDLALRMELDARRANVLVRAVPLRSRDRSRGAVVLIRDVTEVKRRDLALISKDATIREIHHRVKNNLQSVSALLRLQARRSGNQETIQALAEAVRRVSSIALVHEMLSGSVDEEVDLDAIVDRVSSSLVDVTLPDGGGARVRIRRDSRLGVLAADLAMPLVMVLTEVLQNSIEHGFSPGQQGALIVIDAVRDVRSLQVRVTDNGKGLPPDFDLAASDRLGLQIVRTLVSNDLRGTIDIAPVPIGVGTRVELDIPLH
ncbi:sensor histidine kinase [Gordonia humi]|uniref:histidine kinase n=1 Tax=Gordonia humi TaxID=686429 RepID=A0A840F5A7_9ACTN|nr:PAS domain-containing sensor histidine kinase [Gordonia humi]MBB4137608.1 two-component sensor histidine kinase [Gordonia humi]